MSSLILCDGNCDMCEIRDNCPLSLEFKKKLAEESFAKNNSIESELPLLTDADVMFEIQESLFNFIQGWEIMHSAGLKINKRSIAKSIMILFPYEIDDIYREQRDQFSKIIKAIAGKIFLIATGKCKKEKEKCNNCCLREYCIQIARVRSGKPIIT